MPFPVAAPAKVAFGASLIAGQVVKRTAQVPRGRFGRLEKDRLVEIVEAECREIPMCQGINSSSHDFVGPLGVDFWVSRDRAASLMSASSLISDLMRPSSEP